MKRAWFYLFAILLVVAGAYLIFVDQARGRIALLSGLMMAMGVYALWSGPQPLEPLEPQLSDEDVESFEKPRMRKAFSALTSLSLVMGGFILVTVVSMMLMRGS